MASRVERFFERGVVARPDDLDGRHTAAARGVVAKIFFGRRTPFRIILLGEQPRRGGGRGAGRLLARAKPWAGLIAPDDGDGECHHRRNGGMVEPQPVDWNRKAG